VHLVGFIIRIRTVKAFDTWIGKLDLFH